jgi:hypothetical protein
MAEPALWMEKLQNCRAALRNAGLGYHLDRNEAGRMRERSGGRSGLRSFDGRREQAKGMQNIYGFRAQEEFPGYMYE